MKTSIFYAILSMLMLFSALGYTQGKQTTKILYITPDYQTGKVYDRVRSEISDGIRDGLQEKWLREITNTTWERAPNKSRILQSARANYVLKLVQLPVIKETDTKIKISFKLMYVNPQFEPEGLTWNNALYMLELNDVQDPVNVKDLVQDVCEEIDFYLNSSDQPNLRKFRPRIKIDGFEIADGEGEKIDVVAFRKWLKQILEDKYAENRSYIFYYSRKEYLHYPENSIYLITGSFKKYEPGNDLYQVLLTLAMPNAYDVDPVKINPEKLQSDANQKKELIDRIASVMENNVKYYGTE